MAELLLELELLLLSPDGLLRIDGGTYLLPVDSVVFAAAAGLLVSVTCWRLKAGGTYALVVDVVVVLLVVLEGSDLSAVVSDTTPDASCDDEDDFWMSTLVIWFVESLRAVCLPVSFGVSSW